MDDAGTLINPLIAEGQVHGGVFTGVAQALYEEFVYDEEGNPLTGTFVGYAFPSPADLPRLGSDRDGDADARQRARREGDRRVGDDRRTPAVWNAVLDALAPYGVRHVDMPCNGENVWRALQEAKA